MERGPSSPTRDGVVGLDGNLRFPSKPAYGGIQVDATQSHLTLRPPSLNNKFLHMVEELWSGDLHPTTRDGVVGLDGNLRFPYYKKGVILLYYIFDTNTYLVAVIIYNTTLILFLQMYLFFIFDPL